MSMVIITRAAAATSALVFRYETRVDCFRIIIKSQTGVQRKKFVVRASNNLIKELCLFYL